MSYEITTATAEEMHQFLSTMQFDIRYEKHTSKAGNVSNNIVLYFTPFKGKYLNYIKRYCPQKRSSKSKGPGGNVIYLGLMFRNISKSQLNFDRLHKPWYFRKKKKLQFTLGYASHEEAVEGKFQHWNATITDTATRTNWRWVCPVCHKRSSNKFIDTYNWFEYNDNKAPSHSSYVYMRRLFLLPLTLTEAARGYKVFFDIDAQAEYRHTYDANDKIMGNCHRVNSLLSRTDGICGYVEFLNTRYYTKNCLRGSLLARSYKLVLHRNPLYYKK